MYLERARTSGASRAPRLCCCPLPYSLDACRRARWPSTADGPLLLPPPPHVLPFLASAGPHLYLSARPRASECVDRTPHPSTHKTLSVPSLAAPAPRRFSHNHAMAIIGIACLVSASMREPCQRRRQRRRRRRIVTHRRQQPHPTPHLVAARRPSSVTPALSEGPVGRAVLSWLPSAADLGPLFPIFSFVVLSSRGGFLLLPSGEDHFLCLGDLSFCVLPLVFDTIPLPLYTTTALATTTRARTCTCLPAYLLACLPIALLPHQPYCTLTRIVHRHVLYPFQPATLAAFA
ncbi:uncharacterized protein J3D65DRAFT_618850 [Phyllosticta citribraziliensis]|uniref:Uncharacterized protein n=1 Tax=Phyllosticta citribraziliensis TaxID=989973 RepID=A0ABR1LXY4_9PEZI